MKESLTNNKKIVQIIIASREPGIEIYKEITPNIHNRREVLLTIYTSYQLIDGYKNILEAVRFWVLPQYAIKEEVIQLTNNINTTIIPIIGVPHDLTRAELEKEFNKHKNYFKNIEGKFIIVILGGDTPTEKEKVRYYTASKATKFGRYIGEFVKNNLLVLVFNGPRTEEHNIDKKINENAHVTKVFEERVLFDLSKNKLFLYNFIKRYLPLYKVELSFIL